MTDKKAPVEFATGKGAEPEAKAADDTGKFDTQLRDAEIASLEAREKADAVAAGTQSKEEVAAQDAATKLDDLRAKAEMEKGITYQKRELHTVYGAKVLAIVPPETLAGDHMAQNFGNDPENPKTAGNLQGDGKVRMSRITPDVPNGPVVIEVHPDMVGDYARAGWNKE